MKKKWGSAIYSKRYWNKAANYLVFAKGKCDEAVKLLKLSAPASWNSTLLGELKCATGGNLHETVFFSSKVGKGGVQSFKSGKSAGIFKEWSNCWSFQYFNKFDFVGLLYSSLWCSSL